MTQLYSQAQQTVIALSVLKADEERVAALTEKLAIVICDSNASNGEITAALASMLDNLSRDCVERLTEGPWPLI